jgi:hypothetical protein
MRVGKILLNEGVDIRRTDPEAHAGDFHGGQALVLDQAADGAGGNPAHRLAGLRQRPQQFRGHVAPFGVNSRQAGEPALMSVPAPWVHFARISPHFGKVFRLLPVMQ